MNELYGLYIYLSKADQILKQGRRLLCTIRKAASACSRGQLWTPQKIRLPYLRSGTPLEESGMRWQGTGETQGNSWLGAEGKKATR